MADSSNDPRADLRARLARKAPSAAPQVVLPIVPGAPMPEPEPEPEPELSAAEVVAEARKRADQVARAAGPAVEKFSVMGGAEHTPLPSQLPSGPRVEFVEVKGSEELPTAVKKRRMVVLVGMLIVAIVGFFLGRTVAGSSALTGLHESILLEAKEKSELFEKHSATFELIGELRQELAKVDAAAHELDAKKGDITELEKPLANLIGAMAKFAGNKQAALNPNEFMGDRIYNAAVMKEVIAFAYATKSFQHEVASAVSEAQELLKANTVPPPDRQQLAVVAEPDTFDVEGLGPVPLSKGTIVVQPGPPLQVPGAEGAAAEFVQKVKLEGRAEPVQIKTTQMVMVDMVPFWAKISDATKRSVLTRVATLTSRLLDEAKKLDPKPVIALVQGVGAPAAPAEAPKGE